MEKKLLYGSLRAILGQFTPSSMGTRVFVEKDDLVEPNHFLVLFHERFHYFQMIFTPYGHLKWPAYRTNTIEIIEIWKKLTEQFGIPKKIPIKEYLQDENLEGLKIAYNVAVKDLMYGIYRAIEYDSNTAESKFFTSLKESDRCPVVFIGGNKHRFRVIDILESFAKFEEAMLGELIFEKNLDELIDPNKLKPEYYIALYYFIEQVGVERLVEFPIVCELSLLCAHIPSPTSVELLKKYSPNWRFIKIIESIKDDSNIPEIDLYDDKTFWKYCKYVLKKCNYEDIYASWKSALEYADSSDLSMAKEMKRAIEYKIAHPWMLVYSMRNPEDFMSNDFNSFQPYFTITNDGVFYNAANIQNEEIIFENHLQALSQQICGYTSNYCQDSFKMMCGYSYTGALTCPHYLNGECEGYIDAETDIPEIVLDEKSNIISGCTFEMALNLQGLTAKDIDIGMISHVDFNKIIEITKKFRK